MARRGRWLAIALCALLAACSFAPAPRHDDAPPTRDLVRAEAVRGNWNSVAPPATGWTQVTLFDDWSRRWPRHDGVVWYRLRWQQADAGVPTGLLLNYLCLSGAVELNGSLIARDPSLVEPLSRTWPLPKYFLLTQPLLRQGENVLLVRVSGLAAYQPGLGAVTIGDPAAVQARYQSGKFLRYDIKLVNLAMGAVLAGIFLLLWLMRRKDTVFGWFALSMLVGLPSTWNDIAPSPWPFAVTDAWQALIAALHVVSGACYVLFLLRFGERRYPRLEAAIGLVSVAAIATALLAPAWAGSNRNALFALDALLNYGGIAFFIVRALRTRRPEYLVLAGCLLVPILVSVHDFLLLFGLIGGTQYYLGLTSVLTLFAMAFIVAYRFVSAMRRVESFNVELKHEVDAATAQLGQTLAREHTLALDNTRIGERLNLVRDLHDGFGGSLLGAISALDRPTAAPTPAQVSEMLKELRDDLRLVIDTTTQVQGGDLADLLAGVRHRWNQRFEQAGIVSHWQIEGLQGLRLDPARHLDVLRLLQETLTNVLKHSRARRVEVRIARDGGALRLHVRDDGIGIGNAAPGTGLASVRARALRLGGSLQWQVPADGGTALTLLAPLPD